MDGFWVLTLIVAIFAFRELPTLLSFFKPLYLIDNMNVWSTGAMDRRSIDQRIPLGSKYEPCKNSKLADLFRGNTII
jgi:hypothetical protein